MTAAVPLLESAVAAWRSRPADALPDWFRDRQRRALDAARAADWPVRGAEAWKYTSLYALGQQCRSSSDVGMDRETAIVKSAWTSIPSPAMTFIDGALSGADLTELPQGVSLDALSQALLDDPEALRFAIGREPEDGDVFDQLNTAFARDGAWLRVAPGGGDERWLILRSGGSGRQEAVAWHLAHRIDVGEDGRLRICIDLPSADADHDFATLMSRIRVQRGGRLDLVWLGAPSDSIATIAHTRIDLEAGAMLRMHVLEAGALPSRHDLRIALRGERANARIGGVFLLEGKHHADVQLDLRHEAPNTCSATLWRGIAGDRSRAVFNGHITVAKGADGADAQLGSKSLLLSAQAEIDTKPVLEIYADDVKCAHGATVGQLDAQALFYLRTRGLDENAARALLMRAFAAEALAGDMADSPAHVALQDWLDSPIS